MSQPLDYARPDTRPAQRWIAVCRVALSVAPSAAFTCIAAAFVLGAAAAFGPRWAFEELVDNSLLLAAVGTGLSLIGLLSRGKRRCVAAFAVFLSVNYWWIILAVAYGGVGWLRSFFQ